MAGWGSRIPARVYYKGHYRGSSMGYDKGYRQGGLGKPTKDLKFREFRGSGSEGLTLKGYRV